MRAFALSLLFQAAVFLPVSAQAPVNDMRPYAVAVRHDHMGPTYCVGTLIADATQLRYHSVTQPDHSRTWNYNDLKKFMAIDYYETMSVRPRRGESYQLKLADVGTAAAELHYWAAHQIAGHGGSYW